MPDAYEDLTTITDDMLDQWEQECIHDEGQWPARYVLALSRELKRVRHIVREHLMAEEARRGGPPGDLLDGSVAGGMLSSRGADDAIAAMQDPAFVPGVAKAIAEAMVACADELDARAQKHACAGYDCATCGVSQVVGKLRALAEKGA